MILSKIFLRGIDIELSRIKKKLSEEIIKIREEIEEHLLAINENTNEIAANYEHTCELERKIDKQSERIDQIQLYLESNSNPNFSKGNILDVRRLDRREQEVFLVIYTLEEEIGYISYSDIASKLHMSEQLAGSYVTSLIEKGVPLIKRYINAKPFFRIDPEFKTLQIKENILQLSLQEFGF